MAFVSSGYNPEKPMEGRISDIVLIFLAEVSLAVTFEENIYG